MKLLKCLFAFLLSILSISVYAVNYQLHITNVHSQRYIYLEKASGPEFDSISIIDNDGTAVDAKQDAYNCYQILIKKDKLYTVTISTNNSEQNLKINLGSCPFGKSYSATFNKAVLENIVEADVLLPKESKSAQQKLLTRTQQ